jgi:hypothetical protein
MRAVFDLEGTSLLDHTSIDYTASPYVLRPEFRVHCLVVKDIDSQEEVAIRGCDPQATGTKTASSTTSRKS